MMTATLLLHLDAAHQETAELHLEEASSAAEDYGRMAAGFGLSLSQTVEGFVRFRAPFHRELALTARRRGFDAAETTDLLVASERAMDRLLIATMRGHGDPVREPQPLAVTEAHRQSRGTDAGADERGQIAR